MTRNTTKCNKVQRSTRETLDAEDEPQFVSLSRMARSSGINYRTLKKAIDTGRLKAVRFGSVRGKISVHKDEMRRFLQSGSGDGRTNGRRAE